MRTLVFVFLSFVSGRLAADGIVSGSVYSRMDTSWLAGLPVKNSQRPAYIMKGAALEIITVTTDGEKVTPQTKVAIVDFDWSTYKPASDLTIYYVDLRSLRSAIWVEGELVSDRYYVYAVSPKAKEVTIHYRVHFPDGSASGVNKSFHQELNFLQSQRARAEGTNRHGEGYEPAG